MKKTLLSLAFSILFLAIPASAQHGHGGGGGQRGGGGSNRGGENRGGGHVQNQPQHDNRGRGVQHENPRSEQQFHQNNSRQGYHYSGTPRGEFRNHWDGRRFDRDFFDAHWGYRHPFYWGHAGWYGPRWGIGSYFWFDGVYFSVIDPIPPYWYNDAVTIIYDEDCDCYYAVDPVYPGVRIHVGVRF